MYGHFWFWTPTGLSAGTRLSNALNADSNLGLYHPPGPRGGNEEGSLSVFIHSSLNSLLTSFPAAPSCAAPTGPFLSLFSTSTPSTTIVKDPLSRARCRAYTAAALPKCMLKSYVPLVSAGLRGAARSASSETLMSAFRHALNADVIVQVRRERLHFQIGTL